MSAARRILVAGAGYVGAVAAEVLARRGHRVFAARRRPEPIAGGVTPVAVDLLHGELDGLPEQLDAVVWAVSPEPSPTGYRDAYVAGPTRLLTFLHERGDRLDRAVMVTSSSVWSHTDGRDVDETTPPNPRGFRGETVLAGERALHEAPCTTVCLRFTGIYGPGRTRTIDGVRSGSLRPPQQANFGNRIWRDDGANAIAHVLELDAPDDTYLVTDDDPADLREVYAWLADRLGTRLPDPDPAPSGRGGNKRCRNHRLRATGFALDVPDFRTGYSILLSNR